MSQRCFRSFWVRVPRKLKKAAKYGVKKTFASGYNIKVYSSSYSNFNV